jgi:PAS domain S-box-containing protein
MSNRQIALELVLTAGTVANHVRSILLRTGFRSRAQVAAWLGVPGRVGLEGMPDAAAVLDPSGRILTANPALSTLLGQPIAAVEGRALSHLVHEAPVWVDDALRRVTADGAWRGELRLRRPDGGGVPVEITAQAIDTSAGTFYVASFHDLSDRWAIERRQREFVAMLGHEFRSPLAAIQGYAQLMRARGQGDPAALDVIVHQSRRLERLANDLIDLTRQDVGLLRLQRAPLDLRVLASTVVEHARVMAPTHRFAVDAPAGELVGEWDRGRLEQVLDNLVSNAVRYSPDGGRVLVRVSQRGPNAEVAVSDQGVGIPAEALPHLFERFYRVERSGDPVVEGLGLGLAVARALVEAHGGVISAASEPGRGTTMTVVLPLRVAAHA